MSNMTIQLGNPTYILSTVKSTIFLFMHLKNYYKAIILHEYETNSTEMEHGEEIKTNLPTEHGGLRFNTAFTSTQENLTATELVYITEEEIHNFNTDALISTIFKRINVVWRGGIYV